MPGGAPTIVVHSPSDVEVDDRAGNVTAAPVVEPGPLPPRSGPGSEVMLEAPADVLGITGEFAVVQAARSAGDNDDDLTVSFAHARVVDGATLARLSGIAAREGVARLHVRIARRG